MRIQNIYIIEDEEILRVSLADELREAGYKIQEFDDPIKALQVIQKNPPDVVITDIKMPQMDGMELLSQIKSINSDTTVILMTAYGSVESAVEAMKKGAYDYITKPFQLEEMLLLLERIKELRSLKQENIYLRSHFESQYDLGSMVGKSSMVQKILESVKNIASSSTTILITKRTVN
jgi:DNA-binding NtrC family response regulator